MLTQAKMVKKLSYFMSNKMPQELSAQEFRSSVLNLLEKYTSHYKSSLEDYLISLWTVIEKYKDHAPSYSLFVILIDEAFLTPPGRFKQEWLVYANGLYWDYQNDGCVVKEFKDGEWIISTYNVNDFEILKHTILFQIADLHRMPAETLNDPQRFFGVQSPTGNSWYNFTPFDYWECATRGMEDHLRSNRSPLAHQFTKQTWAILAALLSLGQLYE